MVVYLIETIIGSQAFWWQGDGWTDNSWKAIWYSRKIDAENTLNGLSDIPDEVYVAEHMFIS